LRLDLRSAHEGSVPRSMLSHLPLLRLIMGGLLRGQSVLLWKSPQSIAAGAHTPSPLESLQFFSKLSLGSSPAPSQCTESGAVVRLRGTFRLRP
jgi:hypothetical protein